MAFCETITSTMIYNVIIIMQKLQFKSNTGKNGIQSS